jgi:hypothetical protein
MTDLDRIKPDDCDKMLTLEWPSKNKEDYHFFLQCQINFEC